MRLLNAHTLKLEEFPPGSIPKYAILSHRWEQEEVVFEDIKDFEKAREKHGFAKLAGACELARKNSFEFIWIDTCQSTPPAHASAADMRRPIRLYRQE